MLSLLQNRKAYVTHFKSLPVEQEQLDDILYAAEYSPSMEDKRAWEFVTITDDKLKEALSLSQSQTYQIAEAPVVIALCSKDWKYWVEDLSIVADNISLEAANQGLGTCMLQVYGKETIGGKDAEVYVREVLNIPSNIRILSLMPIGYPDEMDQQAETPFLFQPQKLHFNHW